MTNSQRTQFFQLVNRAWKEESRNREIPRGQKTKQLEQWRKATMKEVVGTTSTGDLGKARDYERLMAHFETIADDSTEWQQKAQEGDLKRMRYNLNKTDPSFLDRFDGSAALNHWLLGIASQSLQRDITSLSALTDAQMQVVTRSALIYVTRTKVS